MNLYYAIIAAAEQIERDPGSFKFNVVDIPKDECGSPGCALGWIAFFADFTVPANHDPDFTFSPVGVFARDFMKVPSERGESLSEMAFYGRMDRLNDQWETGTSWIDSPQQAAQTLRLYAEKYHSHEKRRPTSELVADLMAKVNGVKIPEEA